MGHGTSGGSIDGARIVGRGCAPSPRPTCPACQRPISEIPHRGSDRHGHRDSGRERWKASNRSRNRRGDRCKRHATRAPQPEQSRANRSVYMTLGNRSQVIRVASITTALLTIALVVPDIALAAPVGGGAVMPWTGPLQSLLDNLSGPTARIIGALAFVVGGALWAFTRHEEGAKRFGQAIVGIAVMIGAANIVAALAFVGATV